MNEMFKTECEEIGVDYQEFPYDFAAGTLINYNTLTKALMWVLKKRQDKMMGIQNGQETNESQS